jgi:hypothetical protein
MLLDAPRAQPFARVTDTGVRGNFDASDVFRAAVALARFGAPRKGAENRTRGRVRSPLIRKLG